MRSEATYAGWAKGLRSWTSQPGFFPAVTTAVVALSLLAAGASAILSLRSIKYLVALVAVALIAVVWLRIPQKLNALIFMSGFSFPFYVEIILVSRGSGILAISGTILVALAIAVMGFATGIVKREGIRLEPAISLPCLFFMIAGLLSLSNTSDKTLTLIAVVKQVEMLLLFLVLVNAVRRRGDLEWFLRGLYAGFLCECAIYVIQNALGVSFDIVGNARNTGSTDLETGRIGSQRGTFATSATMAALYFSVVSLSLVGLFLSQRTLLRRFRPLLGACAGVACLILAAKRAPLGGFVLGMATIVVLGWRLAPAVRGSIFKVAAGLIIPVVVLLPLLLLRAEANHEADYEERVNLTRVAWEMFDANPILGVGFGTYDSVKRSYLPEGWSGWLSTVHNRYLSTLAETGVIGELAFLVMLTMIVVKAYQGIGRVREAFIPFQISILACLVAICWEMSWDIFLDRQHEYLLWILAAIAVVVPRALPREHATGAR